MGEYSGLVAVVTGGASGIGAATGRLLIDRGARVAIIDRTEPADSNGAFFVHGDISDAAGVESAVRRIADAFGGIDIVINNAGVGASGDITENDDDEWLRVLDVNVVGAVRVSRAALPYLKRSDHAAIVNTCSTIAFVGVPNRALYSASKGAIASLTLAMAADHVADGIRVVAVAPGTADTPWVKQILKEAVDPVQAAEALRRRQPSGRLVSAEEIAGAIAYLASPQSGSTTGTILTVDGGMSGVRIPAS
jgi:2-keto-3-deoxy-L-fuconate dehydrogenase